MTEVNQRPKTGTEMSAEGLEKVSAIVRARGKTHGDAFLNLADIGARWTSRLRAKGYTGPDLNVADVAYFMNEVKMSRSAFGNPEEPDHLDDCVGYSAIGAAWLRQEALRNKSDKDMRD